MKNDLYDILFYFKNEEISIVEISLKNLASDASKDKKFHWLKITNSKAIEKLDFKSMGSEIVNGNTIQIREFSNASLRFDEEFGKFSSQSTNSFIVQKSKPDEITDEEIISLNSFVSSL